MSKPVQKRTMGRPEKPGGAAVVVPVRIDPKVLDLLDNYAQHEDITRSEAVRQLIEMGLKAKGKTQ